MSINTDVLRRDQALGAFRQGVDPLKLSLAICALGLSIFSNRDTVAIIFGRVLTSAAAQQSRSVAHSVTASISPTHP